jgi:hypothetical protein
MSDSKLKCCLWRGFIWRSSWIKVSEYAIKCCFTTCFIRYKC